MTNPMISKENYGPDLPPYLPGDGGGGAKNTIKIILNTDKRTMTNHNFRPTSRRITMSDHNSAKLKVPGKRLRIRPEIVDLRPKLIPQPDETRPQIPGGMPTKQHVRPQP